MLGFGRSGGAILFGCGSCLFGRCRIGLAIIGFADIHGIIFVATIFVLLYRTTARTWVFRLGFSALALGGGFLVFLLVVFASLQNQRFSRDLFHRFLDTRRRCDDGASRTGQTRRHGFGIGGSSSGGGRLLSHLLRRFRWNRLTAIVHGEMYQDSISTNNCSFENLASSRFSLVAAAVANALVIGSIVLFLVKHTIHLLHRSHFIVCLPRKLDRNKVTFGKGGLLLRHCCTPATDEIESSCYYELEFPLRQQEFSQVAPQPQRAMLRDDAVMDEEVQNLIPPTEDAPDRSPSSQQQQQRSTTAFVGVLLSGLQYNPKLPSDLRSRR